MKHVSNIIISVVIGLFVVAITNQLTSSKFPPCDLVVRGIGISTYGCRNTTATDYPCKNEAANSEDMKSCVQANYYRSKTFPFGFTQHFGDSSNHIDKKPILMNAIASFVTAVVASLAVLYLVESKRSSKKRRKSKSQSR